MKVKEVMKRIVHTVRAGDTLDVVSRHIANENIGLLPVMESAVVKESRIHKEVLDKLGFMPVIEEEVLVGVVTTRDIVVRAIAADKDPKTTPVSEIMTTHFDCCQETDDIEDAMENMERQKVRRLFVLDRENRLVGLVSRHDLWAARNGIPGPD